MNVVGGGGGGGMDLGKAFYGGPQVKGLGAGMPAEIETSDCLASDLKMLSEAIADLDLATANLQARLEALCRPGGPTKTKSEGPTPPRSPLGNAIQNHACGVRLMVVRLHDLLERLEV